MEEIEESISAPPLTPKKEDMGKLQHGCEHYMRRCKIRAPCCDLIFPCRHCHNKATSLLSNPKDHHELVRKDVKQVICSICNTEQQVAQVCCKCGVNMGEYFCNICKFYDDETQKGQYHCAECGICRVGGQENFFHCQKCGSCYTIKLLNNHICVENSMKNCCPICYEYLFDSVDVSEVMRCGHTIHFKCSRAMETQNLYRCPICSKTVMDMSTHWAQLEDEIRRNPMPEEYHYQVSILCNECSTTSSVPFHFVGHKCTQCRSYNTRQISSST